MAGWWESLSVETLRAIHTWAQIAGLFCTLGLLVAGYFVFASSGRLSELAARAETQLREEVSKTQEKLQQAEQKRQPRVLTNDQKVAISAVLRGTQPGRVDVESIVGDLEGDNYANEWEQLFSQAEWRVTRARATGNHGIQPGLRLIVPAGPPGQPVSDAFTQAGVAFRLETAPIDYVWIRVGVKPDVSSN